MGIINSGLNSGAGNIETSRLTEEEREVLSHLSEAWNKFIKLPKQHPQQYTEFNAAIHSCQYLVMIRPTVRAEGWIKGDDGKIIPGQNESSHS